MGSGQWVVVSSSKTLLMVPLPKILLTTYYLLLTAYCLLLTTYYLLLTPYSLLLTTYHYYLLPTTHYLLPDGTTREDSRLTIRGR